MAQATSTGGMVAGCGGRAACRCAAASRAASKGDSYNRAWDAFDARCGAQGLPALRVYPGIVPSNTTRL